MKTFFFYGVASAVLVLASCATINVKSSLRGDLRGALTAESVHKSSMLKAFHKRTRQQILGADPLCGVTSQATSSSERGANCPASCPLYVQDRTDSMFCSFRCVQATIQACKSMNPEAPVPDTHLGVCRGCEVSGCADCATDGSDTCHKCKDGFWTTGDGHCYTWINYIWYVIFGVVGVLSVAIGTWVWSLSKRANQIDNIEGLERGLDTRSAAKLHQPLDPTNPDNPRELWPMSTNLLTTPVAGNGVCHLFNFQFAIIMWSVGVVVAWLILGFVVDTDFFRLGTRSPGETPRDNCIIIAWGFETQSRLMYAKYMFVLGLYVVTFIGTILYAVRQLRFHHTLDEVTVSHKDYAAKCTGFPAFSGKEHVEDELLEIMMSSTGQKVLGVSICWDFAGKDETIMKVIDYDTEERINADHHTERRAQQLKQKEAIEGMNSLDQAFVKWENTLLSPNVQKIVKKAHNTSPLTKSSANTAQQKQQAGCPTDAEAALGEEAIDVVQELEQLYSTEDAFIVFETEAARDAAIKAVADMGGVDFHDSKLQLEDPMCEPQAVNWTQITNRTWLNIVMRASVGFLVVVLALAVWCFAFYLPYARSVAKTDYAHGKDPNPLTKTMFGLIVVAGNAMMYVVCAEVSDRVGFKTQAKREVCYMLLYCFACVFNVLLDLVMAYTMAYKTMVGLGVRTHSGESLGEVDTFADRFDTYAMQKSLGTILFDYSFPSTFLIPFLAEPFVVIIAPYQLMSLIVRSNPSILGSAAEAYLASCPMDLSRYADVLLNLMLAVLMFFFPGGFILKIFIGLIISHIVIYAYDHSRVLASIPACDFATMSVDWWAQWMLSIPTGLLLACALFKANCDEDSLHCFEDGPVIWWCFGLFFGHILVHTLVLVHVVPLFAPETEPSMQPYAECAAHHPCSWFAANPVHCLRSKYIYQEDPPCDYFILGKDHMLRKNLKLNLFYEAKTPRKEQFDISAMAKDAKRAASTKLSGLRRSMTGNVGGEDDVPASQAEPSTKLGSLSRTK